MGIPQPKYHVGQKVFCGRVNESGQEHTPCVDCLGSGYWQVITPAGEKFATACNTCNPFRTTKGRGIIVAYVPKPYVETLTIGSIRIDTGDNRTPVVYMCEETGVGSGTLWSEDAFSSDYDIAMELAKVKVFEYTERQNKTMQENRENAKRQTIEKPSHKT